MLTACQQRQQPTVYIPNDPVSTPTSPDGYYMKANIDGKNWIAGGMTLGFEKYMIMGFTAYQVNLMLDVTKENKEGSKIPINEQGGASIHVGGADAPSFDHYKGEIIITRNDGKWLEGTFAFTGNDYRYTEVVKVTDGFFRVPILPDTHI
jgi:hypothetical protein